MDWDLIIIFGFVLVIVSMVLPFAYIINQRVQRHEKDKLELEARIEEAKAAQAAAPNEVQAHLEDRLRVVERIVTDPSSNLAKEIEDLRSQEMEKN